MKKTLNIKRTVLSFFLNLYPESYRTEAFKERAKLLLALKKGQLIKAYKHARNLRMLYKKNVEYCKHDISLDFKELEQMFYV